MGYSGGMILAGDIGGTNTRLGLFEKDSEGHLRPGIIEVFSSRAFESLERIVETFVQTHKASVRYAAFGVPGPVREGEAETSNLPWLVQAGRLSSVLDLKRVDLINDLESTAFGIAELGAEDFVILNEGSPERSGNEALIAAGTGLGEAGLTWEGHHYRPFPSEGGHVDFGPRNDLELDLLRYLQRDLDHVSYERVLSGPGLVNIYCFLRDSGRSEESEGEREEVWTMDPAASISRLGLEGKYALCEEALRLFVQIYGAETGNMALKILATGGVFVGGGIAPKIVSKLREPLFMQAFAAKGRMQELLESIPVRVIMNDLAALLGAARVAAHGGVWATGVPPLSRK